MVASNIFEEVTKPRNLAIGVGIIGVGVVLAARKLGVRNLGNHSLPTEQALSAYSGVAGIGGFLAQILASRQLSQVSDDAVPLKSLAIPVAVSAGATAASAFLLPSS